MPALRAQPALVSPARGAARVAAWVATRVAMLVAASVAAPGAVAGPWHASEGNTRGWALMTPQERVAHQAAVRAFTDLAACRAYQQRHYALMAARAREAGLSLAGERRDLCAHLAPPPGASAPAARPR